MNEMNALTLTNNNLVAFLCFLDETISGYHRVAFSLRTKVCGKKKKKKPSIVNQQRVVYQFKCSFCDENYIGFTMRHLHERCEENKFNSSSIKKHFNNQHDCLPDNINQHFTVFNTKM